MTTNFERDARKQVKFYLKIWVKETNYDFQIQKDGCYQITRKIDK